MKHKTPLILLTILMLVLSACSGGTVVTESNTQTNATASDVTAQGSTSQAVDSTSITADFDDDDFTSTVNETANTIQHSVDDIVHFSTGRL